MPLSSDGFLHNHELPQRMTHTRYTKKIAAQAEHFYVKDPVMPDWWKPDYDWLMTEYKPISAAFNQENCRCDRLKAAHEEKHGDSYPYFRCECGKTDAHRALTIIVKQINVMQAMQRIRQNEGALAHIRHGERAWQAKQKWKSMKFRR